MTPGQSTYPMCQAHHRGRRRDAVSYRSGAVPVQSQPARGIARANTPAGQAVEGQLRAGDGECRRATASTPKANIASALETRPPAIFVSRTIRGFMVRAPRAFVFAAASRSCGCGQRGWGYPCAGVPCRLLSATTLKRRRHSRHNGRGVTFQRDMMTGKAHGPTYRG
jgi:hypothetical protein